MSQGRGPPPDNGGGIGLGKRRSPWASQFSSNQHRFYTPKAGSTQTSDLVPPASTAQLMQAFATALSDTKEDAERANLCLWIASRGFLGLAHEQGFAAAADIAYRFADQLAGGA